MGCLFEVGSWVYDNSKVMITFHDDGYKLEGSSTPGKNAEFAQYNITDAHLNFKSYNSSTFGNYPQNDGNWSCIQYNVILERNHLHYTLGIVIPQGLLTFISFGAFFLPPSSGERIAFTITIPLAISVYKLLMFQQLPASDEPVFATMFSFGCFLFAIIVVMESIFVTMLWWRTHPYFLKPLKSFKKLIIDMKEKTYWVNIVKAVDVEMTRQKVQQNKTRKLSAQPGGLVRTIRRQISRNQQNYTDIELTKKDLATSSQTNPIMQNVNQNQHADNLKEYYSFQSDDLVRPRLQQVTQEEDCNTMTIQNSDDFIDIEENYNIQNIPFPLQNMQQAPEFLAHVLENKKYAKESFDCLCETYPKQIIQNELFKLMGVVDSAVSDFEQIAKIKYNEKWQKLSNCIDRICQCTIIPAFLVFGIVFTILGVV